TVATPQAPVPGSPVRLPLDQKGAAPLGESSLSPAEDLAAGTAPESARERRCTAPIPLMPHQTHALQHSETGIGVSSRLNLCDPQCRTPNPPLLCLLRINGLDLPNSQDNGAIPEHQDVT